MANFEIAVTLSFAVQFFVRDRKKSGGKKTGDCKQFRFNLFEFYCSFTMDGFYENLLLTKSQFNCDVKYL